MAIRIHVLGALGVTREELLAALDTIGDDGHGSQRFRLGASNNWQWAQGSVWHVDGDAIDRALAPLAVPTFRVTTVDGVLWMLTLQAPGQEPFHGVHHFTGVGSEPNTSAAAPDICDDPDFPADDFDEIAGIHRYIPELEFLWDEDEEARVRAQLAQETEETVPGLDEYTSYGASLPPETIEAMRRAPHRAPYLALHAHSRQIVDALQEFGIPCDREALLALLTTGPLTAREQHSDVGNLPRFLDLLGVAGVFQESGEDEAAGEEAPAEPTETPRLNLANHAGKALGKRFDKLLPKIELRAIEGGVVETSHLALLHLLSHLLCEHPDARLAIQMPAGDYEPSSCWEPLEALEVVAEPNGWRFCWKNAPYSWYGVAEPRHLNEHSITAAVRDLPDGTRWDLAMRVDGLREKCHRYSGVYASGRWRIEQAYPAVTHDQLSEVLALVANIFHCQQPIPLVSEDEAAAVRRSYRRANGQPAKIRRSKVKIEYGTGATVVQAILFERYKNSGPWDVVAARNLVEEDWEEFDEMMADDSSEDNADDEDDGESLSPAEAAELEQFNEKMKQLNASLEALKQRHVVAHRPDVAYEGSTGCYWHANFADLPHVPASLLDETDAALKQFGFSSLGDFAADVDQRQSITRCYAGHPEAVALFSHRQPDNSMGWASMDNSLVSVDFSKGNFEFHTDFEDGTCLTTASVDGARSNPEAGVFVRCYEEIPLTKLWEKHLDGIKRFRQHRRTQPRDHRPLAEPAALLARMDRLFATMMKLSEE